MAFLEPIVLVGELVTLEPLSRAHHDGLVEAVNDGELWNLWYTRIPAPGEMRAEIGRRLDLQAVGQMLPFATVETATGEMLGMTTFMNIDEHTRRVEIGSTWTRLSAQRTGVNAESKLLLLTHAFDTLHCVAVELRTHWHNHQSRQAILRLGAKPDGVLRNHMRMPDGSLRDTAVYSIIESEWPAVRSSLRHRLTAEAGRTTPSSARPASSGRSPGSHPATP